LKAGEFDVDEALASDMYEILIDRLSQNGFEQYEIANFARVTDQAAKGIPGYACRHNVNYWVGGEYLALGPAAAGHLDGQRYQNWSNTDLYCEAVKAGRLPRDGGERLKPLAKASETAAFSLRMNRGIYFDEFESRTGYSLNQTWRSELDGLVQRGWGERMEQGFRLTREGFRFADAAGGELLKDEV
ncbi:MAG: coproporphyrinogen III oxidase, partial [Opitutales bacterium]|nr:coproporphyrinogen III oxidase [Opitutales bacterium]